MGLLVLGLMAGTVGVAEATQRPTRLERTVERSYGSYPAPVTGCNSVLGSYACVIIPTRTSEAFFTAKVTDVHGQPVFVEVKAGNVSRRFCGETTEAIRFKPGAELHFFVALPNWGIQLDCPAHSIKTTGTISVTLANVPPARPVRSGTIVTGTATSGDAWAARENHLGTCELSPACGAWLASGCNPALSNRDPAAMASIVGVGDLADGRTTRVFGYEYAKPGPNWGPIDIQFWRQDCTQIHSARWRSWQEGRHGDAQHLTVPMSAEWMTVSTTVDNARFAWTLT